MKKHGGAGEDAVSLCSWTVDMAKSELGPKFKGYLKNGMADGDYLESGPNPANTTKRRMVMIEFDFGEKQPQAWYQH